MVLHDAFKSNPIKLRAGGNAAEDPTKDLNQELSTGKQCTSAPHCVDLRMRMNA